MKRLLIFGLIFVLMSVNIVFGLEGTNIVSEVRTFQVDNTKPSIIINFPASDSLLNNKTITINLTAIDINLNYTNISIINSTGAIINTTTNSTNGTYTVTLSVSTDGFYNITATAYDKATNSNTTTNTNITIDTTDPLSNSPADTSYYQDSAQTIGWVLTDETATGNYTVYRNGTIQNSSASWTNNTNLNVWVNTTTIGDNWNYTIHFNDSAGNNGIPDTVLINITEIPEFVWNLNKRQVLYPYKKIIYP